MSSFLVFATSAPVNLRANPTGLETYIFGQGWHRIFSTRGQVDFIKGVCKLVFIGILVWTVVRWQRNAFIETMSLDPAAIPELILMIATRLLSVVCLLTFLLLAVELCGCA